MADILVDAFRLQFQIVHTCPYIRANVRVSEQEYYGHSGGREANEKIDDQRYFEGYNTFVCHPLTEDRRRRQICTRNEG